MFIMEALSAGTLTAVSSQPGFPSSPPPGTQPMCSKSAQLQQGPPARCKVAPFELLMKANQQHSNRKDFLGPCLILKMIQNVQFSSGQRTELLTEQLGCKLQVGDSFKHHHPDRPNQHQQHQGHHHPHQNHKYHYHHNLHNHHYCFVKCFMLTVSMTNQAR